VKELKAELQRFAGGELFRTAEELRIQRIYGADVRRSGRATLFDIRTANRRQNHEQLVAFDRVVAFENVLIVRIPPATAFERNVAATRAAIAVAIVFRKYDAPAIRRLAPLWRRRRTSRWWRNGNIDDCFLTGFDHDVLERVATHDSKVAVVF